MNPLFEWCRLNNSSANCDFSLSLDEEFTACLRWQRGSTPSIYLKPLDPDKPVRLQYHHRMYHKWKRAAARPWWSVEPDQTPE